MSIKQFLFCKNSRSPPVGSQTVLKFENKGKTKQRKVAMRDSNPVPQHPCRNCTFPPPARLISHLEFDENRKKKSIAKV